MSAPANEAHLGVYLQPLDGPSDCRRVADALLAYYAARQVSPNRVTYGGKTRTFSAAKLRAVVDDPAVHAVTLWRQGGDGDVDAHVYLRSSNPAEQRFQTRAVALTWTPPIAAVDAPLRELLDVMVSVYRLAHGQVGTYRSRVYASHEGFGTLGSNSELDAETDARLHEDALCRHKANRMLRRLYPVTIIGPEIWAQLPPMPAFDPMPTVEDLGACKLVTAWPTLCEPRDPEFLRGTRALRAWLWPFTIQNPADHVDNDP